MASLLENVEAQRVEHMQVWNGQEPNLLLLPFADIPGFWREVEMQLKRPPPTHYRGMLVVPVEANIIAVAFSQQMHANWLHWRRSTSRKRSEETPSTSDKAFMISTPCDANGFLYDAFRNGPQCIGVDPAGPGSEAGVMSMNCLKCGAWHSETMLRRLRMRN